ncbi:MAG: tripartite tricarboxylate transporter permease [Candidatus Thermoplasmatota archaeon]|nr:tripartite tricarboxylate transporter permease [Candidatus Thermoplasmatota archaeon]
MDIAAALLAVVVFTLIGVAFGILTGLVPGIHVNTVAAFLLAFKAGMFAAVVSVGAALGVGPENAPILVAVLIVGMLVTHTFLDIIPSIFLGAPNEDTALSVLPGHRMMKQGRGYEAIKASAMGSFGAVFVTMAAVLPARLIMGSPLNAYEALIPIVPWLLIGITVFMIVGERSSIKKVSDKRRERLEEMDEDVGWRDHIQQMGFAALIFTMAGALGIIVLRSPLGTHNILPFPQLETPMLFPMFTGLFGISGLFLSLWDDVEMAPQEIEDVEVGLGRKASIKGVAAGSFAGSLVGWLPGISSASATVVAQAITNRGEKEDADKEFIVAVSGVNTANAVFNTVLYKDRR